MGPCSPDDSQAWESRGTPEGLGTFGVVGAGGCEEARRVALKGQLTPGDDRSGPLKRGGSAGRKFRSSEK